MAQQPPGWGQPAQQQPPAGAPQPPGWGPPPGAPPRPGWGQPPPTPPRRGRAGKVLLIVGGIIAGLVILGSLLPDASTTTDQATEATTAGSRQEPADTTAARPPSTKAAKLGTPVRDGKFEFTVQRIRCGVPRIGSTYFTKRAQGRFCLVAAHVSNIGDEAQTLDASNQYLFDRAGRRYETSDANAYLEDSKALLEEINPGNAVDGTLVFDVPKGFVPSKIELHDSAFSGGVTVQL